MPLIPESNALMLAQNFGSLDAERQTKAREVLRQYRDQQNELGLPEWPSQAQAEQEKKNRLRSFFDDLKAVDAAAPSLSAVLPYSQNPDADRARVANVAYMASRYGKSADEIGGMYDLYRDDYAARLGGRPGLDDLAFHSALKGEVDKERRKEKSFESGAVQAFSGKPALAALAEWQAANPDAKDDTPAFMQAFTAAKAGIRPHLPMVREIADVIEADMNGKGDAKAMQALADKLVDLPGKDRRMVIAGLRMEAEKRGKGNAEQKGGMLGGNFWQQVGESGGRLIMGGLRGGSHAQMQGALGGIRETGAVVWEGGAIDTPEKAREFVSAELSRSLSESMQTAFADNPPPLFRAGQEVPLDATATNLIREAKARVEKQIRVSQEMAALGGEIDPLPSVVASTFGTSGALLGTAILTRGMSAPIAAQMYSGLEYEDLSRKYPMMSHAEKQGIAGLSGGIQSALDLVGVKGLDKLPAVQTLLKQGLTRVVAGRAAAQFGKSYAVENLVEGVQDLTTPVLMSALASDVPGYDWNAELKDWWKGRADVAIGMLPLTLLGVGAVSARDAMGAQSLLGWDLKLGAAGVVEADRTTITELARNGDVDGAQSALKDAWSRRSPEVAAEYQGQMAAREVEAQAAFEEAMRIGLLPTVRRDASGYTVTDHRGESASFPTWQDAQAAATEGMTDTERSNISAVAAMADHFLKSNPNEVFDIKPGESMTLKDRVASGELSAEEAANAAIVAGQLEGMSREEAQEATWHVLGNNRTEHAENVRRSVSTIFAGGNVLTAVEEPVEGRWKAGLESGRYTKEGGVEWVRLAEQATGEKFLPDGEVSDRALIEAISKIVVADVFGRRKDGSRIAPGAVTQGIKAVLQQSAGARGFSAFLRAFRAFFGQVFKTARSLALARQEGKLSADWESQLDELLGIDSQDRFESEAAAEADAIANEALYAGGQSYSEENPGPNGETFSLSKPFEFPAFISRKYQARIDQWEKSGDAGREPINLGFTPPVLRVAGADKLSLIVPPSLFDKATKEKHAVPVEALRALPQSLADPVAVFQSRRDGDAIIVLTEFREEGKGPVVIAIHLNRRAGDLEVNQVASMYGRPDSDIAAMFNEQPLYANQQKRLDQGRQAGKQYPESSTPSQGKGSIPGPDDVVKWAEAEQSKKSFSLRKFDFSSKLAPAAEILRNMRQGGKAFDFASAYRAASAGQSTSMLPLSALYDEAKKQVPALTEADFGKQVQALYDSGSLLLEPGEQADSMRETLGRFGVRDSLGIPAMFARPAEAVQETFSLSVQARGGVPFKAGDKVRSLAFEATVYSVEQRHSDSGYWVVYTDVTKDPVWAKGEREPLPPFAKPFDAYSEPVRVLQRGRSDTLPSRDESLEALKERAPDGVQAETGRLPLYEVPVGEFQYDAPDRGTLGPQASSLKVGDTIDLGGPQTITGIKDHSSGFLWLDFEGGFGAMFHHGSRLKRADKETFSLRSGDFASRMGAAFSPFQRNPEMRLVITQVAKQRALKLGAKWIEDSAVLRTVASIAKEQGIREALGYDERINAYLESLTPSARQELEFEPAALDDDPLVSAMLDYGKLMSQSTAKREGKVDAKAGDYDGAPWLPPAWYSSGGSVRWAEVTKDGETTTYTGEIPNDVMDDIKSGSATLKRKSRSIPAKGGIMPDQMAQAMFDAGLLPDAFTGTLWAALESRIASTKKNKVAHREAVQAYKEAQRAARADAKLEAEAWANQTRKAAGSPKAQRDMLKAALRTLDGILSAAPPVVRARVGGYVKLAGLATDEAMLQEIERRIEKLNVELEKWLKKEGVAELHKLLKRGKPDAKAGKRGAGKDADMHALFAAAERAIPMTAEAVAGELARLDTLIGGDTLTPEQEALAITERGIIELVGDLKSADSGRVFSALDSLREIYTGGWLKWKLRQIEKREERAGMRADFIADTGKSGIKPERDAADKAAVTLLGKIKGGFLSLSSFQEVLSYAFGSKSDRVKALVDAEREASGQYEDVTQALADEVEALFADLAGGSVLAGERLRYDMAQRTIKTGKGELSQLEAIQALLMWRQEDGRRHMEGARDENGKPIGPWNYDQTWIDEITAALTPEARSVMAWLSQKYAAEHPALNALYRERYGVNMPAHDNYAPITVQPVQTKSGEVNDPVSGAAISSGSILVPGSLRVRSRSAIAEPDFRDSLQTFMAHTRQLEYWKAYYDLAFEASAILGNREVLNAVKAKGGEPAATALRKWIDAIAQGGFRDASATLGLHKLLSRMTGRAASVGLLGRFSTLLVQSTQLGAASVKMPVGAYLVRLSKLLTGNLSFRDAINSPFIQRRYKSAPPIVRQALEGLGVASRPNEITRATRHLGQLLSGADAMFTAGTYAMLLDYHRGTGRALGLSGAELETHAHTEAERDTEAVAQPTRMATRSLAELTSTNPLAKVSWAYASEARQKIALMAWATMNAKAEPAQFAKTAFLVFGIGGLMTQVLKNLWREAKGDDDENKWSPERLTLSALAGPLHGVPLASELMGDQGMLSGVAWAWPALVDLVTERQNVMRDVDTLLSAAGLVNDTAAGIASLSHIGLDAAKLLENMTSDD